MTKPFDTKPMFFFWKCAKTDVRQCMGQKKLSLTWAIISSPYQQFLYPSLDTSVSLSDHIKLLNNRINTSRTSTQYMESPPTIFTNYSESKLPCPVVKLTHSAAATVSRSLYLPPSQAAYLSASHFHSAPVLLLLFILKLTIVTLFYSIYLPAKQTNRLQLVLNFAARAITQTPKLHHNTLF